MKRLPERRELLSVVAICELTRSTKANPDPQEYGSVRPRDIALWRVLNCGPIADPDQAKTRTGAIDRRERIVSAQNHQARIFGHGQMTQVELCCDSEFRGWQFLEDDVRDIQ